MYRECAQCGRDLPQTSYTANQYSRGVARSRCVTCVHGHHSDRPSTTQYDSGRHNQSNTAQCDFESLRYPFAEGAFRLVARGTYRDGPRKGSECVLKWFKTGAVFSNDFFTLDIKAVDKALELINHFNRLGAVTKTIKINVPQVWMFTGEAGDWAGQKILVEPFIQHYEKFNSNTGWSDVSMAWGEVMQALSHFSYHISSGQFVLCDLQGGIYRKEVVLSDPVIMSRNRQYGVTDLGPDGISSFFSHHHCNHYCRPNWSRPAKPMQHFDAVPGTTMLQRTVQTEHSRPAGTRRF